MVIVRAVLVGMLVALAGTLPRNLLFAANLAYFPALPWSVPAVAVYLFFFWRYIAGDGPPSSSAAERRESLRARRIALRVWTWALLAGTLGIVALVIALRIVNRFVPLPAQHLPDLSGVPEATVLSLLLAAAPIAGIVEEAAFRGYMQGPIERRHGPAIAILVTGTMFAFAHLDFTPVLWPYYVAVAAIYGTVTFLSKSILPAVVLHTGGNLYSNLDLWLRGEAEWQAPAIDAAHGDASSGWVAITALAIVSLAGALAFARLAAIAKTDRSDRPRSGA